MRKDVSLISQDQVRQLWNAREVPTDLDKNNNVARVKLKKVKKILGEDADLNSLSLIQAETRPPATKEHYVYFDMTGLMRAREQAESPRITIAEKIKSSRPELRMKTGSDPLEPIELAKILIYRLGSRKHAKFFCERRMASEEEGKPQEIFCFAEDLSRSLGECWQDRLQNANIPYRIESSGDGETTVHMALKDTYAFAAPALKSGIASHPIGTNRN